MIDRILVPLDGSRVADQILPHLRRLLHRRDAEVILVRAAVPPPLEDGLLIADAIQGAALEYLREIQDRLEQQGVRVKSVTRVGSAVGIILDVAEEEHTTMIALATHGETGLKRLLAGSVAEAILKKSPVPVLVVRPFWSYELLPSRADREDLRPLRHILLPLDETDDASVLIPPLVELARLFDARVVLLHVQEDAKRSAAGSGNWKARAEEQLCGFARRFAELGVETHSQVGTGDAARDILEASRAHEIDLIAMTSHGKSGFLRFLSSSVTERVLHESTCPMLVVRSEARETGTTSQGIGAAGKKGRP